MSIGWDFSIGSHFSDHGCLVCLVCLVLLQPRYVVRGS